MRKSKWLALAMGALLTMSLIGTALAEPPTPAEPTPPAGNWENMRGWMDSQFGEGFFDKMHGSWEGMTEACNTMAGAGGMMGGSATGSGGMMGGGATGSGFTGSSGMMGGGFTSSGGMMGSGAQTGSAPGRSGVNIRPGNGTSRISLGSMMGNFLGGLRSTVLPNWF